MQAQKSNSNPRLSKVQQAKLIAERKEQERVEAQLKKQQDEEQRHLQEQIDVQEFTTMPRVNLELRSAFGINENLRVNEMAAGTTFKFLCTPSAIGISGKPKNDVKLLCITGRQLALRDFKENTVHMVPNQNHSHQITALTTQFSGDCSRIAMAESDFYDQSQLYFNIFDVHEDNEIRPTAKRIRIELPEEELAHLWPVEEEPRTRRNQDNHSRTMNEFSSAAASSSQAANIANNGITSVLSAHDKVKLPFVSQICFSNNFQYVACLISGPINRVAIYETKAGKIKLVASENFHLITYQEEVASPVNNDQSRFTDKSKLSTRTFYAQAVTQISFNPRHSLSVFMTGPNCRVDFCKIERNELLRQNDPKIDLMRELVGDYANITAHAWSSDGDYFGVCTEDAQICVYRMGFDICLHVRYELNAFVNLQFHNFGLVAISSDGHFIFYELSQGEELEYKEIRTWQYVNEQIDLGENMELVHGFQVLNQDYKMLAVQLCDRSVMIIDMWEEVYLQDKRDDIAMKLQEHQNILNSDEERVRINYLKGPELQKAREAREKEREAISAIDFQLMNNGFHSGEITEMHTCLQRPVILTMSQQDQTIRLWNYFENTCELEQNFALGLGEQKPLISCALHPSGYYLAVALTDHIRLYHILHPDLKQFNQYDYKNTKRIKFSSGGQYFCSVDHKNVHIFSTYTLERVRTLQIPPNTLSTIQFNFNDSRIVFVSADGLMQCFDLEEFSRIGELRNDRSYAYKNAIFLAHSDQSNNQIVVVGTKKEESASLRIFDGDDMKACMSFRDELESSSLCFNDVIKIVSAEQLIENLVIGTNRGSLIVHGMPPRFLREDPQYRYAETMAHFGEVSSLQASICGKYVFSAGTDGIIFMYEVVEHTPQTRGRMTLTKQESTMQQPSVIETGTAGTQSVGSARIEKERTSVTGGAATDNPNIKSPSVISPTGGANLMLPTGTKKGIEVQDELGRIVLVGKGLMEDWRKSQETLRTEMEKQHDIVDSSLRAENFSFIQRTNEMEKEKTKLLNDLDRSYESLQMKEAELKDENQQKMNKEEINHNVCKEELQDLYDRKLAYEQEQFRKLKEYQNDMKQRFEAEIKQLNDRHDADVEELLDDFKQKLQEVQGLYEDSKKVSDDLKMKNEEKLTSQEQDQLFEINELSDQHKEVVEKFTKQISELKNNIERQKYHKKKIEAEIKDLENKTAAIKNVTEKLKEQGKDFKQQIKDLDDDKKDATANLKKKEAELFQQKFKIKDLQKKKQVLTHRTHEMKASLEPKEQQIESLKQNLHDLEKLFHMQNKSLKQMEANVDAKGNSIANLERKRKQARVNTKKKEHQIQEFVQDIQKTMQKPEDADKLQGFMAIYRNYVKKQSEEVMTKKQKDPELIDQLDKHLKFREKEIRQLQENSVKTSKKSKKALNERTKENKNLIFLLEELRGNDETRQREQANVDKDITKIQLENRRVTADIDRMKEEMQKMKQQELTRPGFHKASSIYNRPKEGDNKVADQFRRSQSRGKLIKGSLFNNRPAGMYKQQIQELLGSLDEANQTIVLQNLQITTLRDEFEAARRAINGAPAPQGGSDQKHQHMRGDIHVLGSQFTQPQMVQTQQNIMMDHGNMDDSEAKNNSRQDLDGQPLPNGHYRQ